MLSYNLTTFDAAEKLINLCRRYKEKMEIDVNWWRYIVDATSMLGVHSLIGHIVPLDPQTDDKELFDEFEKDLKEIK